MYEKRREIAILEIRQKGLEEEEKSKQLTAPASRKSRQKFSYFLQLAKIPSPKTFPSRQNRIGKRAN